MAARRVADEMGEALGETVGYRVRFEDVSGPKTKLWYLTEGVLTRRLLADTELRDARLVVLDEFHERHLGNGSCLGAVARFAEAAQRSAVADHVRDVERRLVRGAWAIRR